MKTVMKRAMTGALAIGACVLTATSSWGVQTVNLRAEAFTQTIALPGGGTTNVLMWGFAQDAGAPSVPGPTITIAPGETELIVNLVNNLNVPISLVIPGQDGYVRSGPAEHSTFVDVEGRTRARSFAKETLGGGGTNSYRWIGLRPGTYIYHSGSHSALQVQMGLYGMLKQDAVAGQAYGIPYAAEINWVFGEIDLDVHNAVQAGTYGTTVKSMIHSTPELYLLNGEPLEVGQLTLPVGQTNLLRMINACFDERIPVLNGQYVTVLAEDGRAYPYPKTENAINLPSLKTRDALLAVNQTNSVKFYDLRRRAVAFYPAAADLTRPTIVSVTAINATTVEVLFSEPMALIPAQTATNYAINRGVTVVSAVLGTDTRTVTLTTSTLTGGDYILTVNNVTDRAAPPNPILPNTQVTFTFTPPAPILSVAPLSLAPTTQVGQNASNQSFEVWNSGGGTLTYSISDNVTWLSVTPTNGTSSGEHDAITVSYNTAALAVGVYNAVITVTALPPALGSPQTVNVTLTVTPAPTAALRVNCGGGAVSNWVADTGFIDASTFSSTRSITNAGVVPQQVYQTERWGPIVDYSLTSVADGTYTVNLHFAELFWTAAGSRVFNVDIEGVRVLTNFDVVAEAGGRDIALVKSFNITVTGGNGIQIRGQATVNNAKFNGIEIIPVGPPPPAIVVDRSAVTVPEGGTTNFLVRLAQAPIQPTTVTVSRISGDTDITVASGSPAIFTATTWSNWQTIVLAAAEDLDTGNGQAVIQCASPGYLSALVTATEADNDVLPPTARQINCGGGAVGTWVADTGFLNGSPYSTLSAIANAGGVPQAVYQTERWGDPLNYSIAGVSNGTYTVNLHFAEIFVVEAGERVFSVDIEGVRRLTNFDIIAEAGGDFRALVKTFTVTVTDGNGLQITGIATVNNAKFSGIEIIPAGPPPPAIVTDRSAVSVREGGTSNFLVRLSQAPLQTTTVTVSRLSGDTSITVASGSPAVFTTTTWNNWQTIGLAAAEDPDTLAGQALIQCTAPGYLSTTVTVTEIDNDVIPPPTVRINCGGAAVSNWIADTGLFTGGSPFSTTRPIANAGTVPQLVYQTERWGNTLSYSIPSIPDGTYTVNLHFAEIYATAAGARVFHVNIEGVRVLTNFDIFAAAGGRDRAVVRSFPVTVTGGNGLQITSQSVVDNAKYSGIEIIPVP
jgi:FtsP/CotA-like multicopper oxidase with cupredoxin domain